jgi:hypothetical protein
VNVQNINSIFLELKRYIQKSRDDRCDRIRCLYEGAIQSATEGRMGMA